MCVCVCACVCVCLWWCDSSLSESKSHFPWLSQTDQVTPCWLYSGNSQSSWNQSRSSNRTNLVPGSNKSRQDHTVFLTHTHIHTHTHTHTHTNTNTQTQTRTLTNKYTCTQSQTHTRKHTNDTKSGKEVEFLTLSDTTTQSPAPKWVDGQDNNHTHTHYWLNTCYHLYVDSLLSCVEILCMKDNHHTGQKYIFPVWIKPISQIRGHSQTKSWHGQHSGQE